MKTPDGRTLLSRADLNKRYGYPTTTLSTWWTARATNGHPPVRHQDGRTMYWDAEEWAEWDRWRQNLIGPREFGALLGHADHTWVTQAATAATPPPGFPAPTQWTNPERRTGPHWPRDVAEEYARDRTPGPARRGGRRPDSSNGAYPYAGDERLDLARRFIAQNPGARTGELVRSLDQHAPGTSRSTWMKILKSARENPEEQA